MVASRRYAARMRVSPLGLGSSCLRLLELAGSTERLADDSAVVVEFDHAELARVSDAVLDHAVDDLEALFARGVRRAGVPMDAVDDEERHVFSLSMAMGADNLHHGVEEMLRVRPNIDVALPECLGEGNARK